MNKRKKAQHNKDNGNVKCRIITLFKSFENIEQRVQNLRKIFG